MKFFSNGTWRPGALEIEEVPTPIGEHCLSCGAAIQADDCGVSMMHMGASGDVYRPWHLACFRRALGIEGDQA
jgi:hypothetical protein